jgi:hypothetical protein
LNGNVQNGEENSDKRILTDLEEADLVRFLIDSNLARDGKNMTEIGIKVRFEGGRCRRPVCSFGLMMLISVSYLPPQQEPGTT